MLLASSNLYADPPGVVYTPELRQQLAVGLQTLGPAYEPRTEHLHEDGQPQYTNRLILEDSPYLRQHAHNPVDWHAWGPEAFAQARRQNKPIFLSIGYSTCHWCHVMERESFESIEVAEYLNAHFISIKVDRERRPDIDEIYMTGVQAIAGRGGWPMSSFLNADGQTFYGGTYYQQARFLTLLQGINKAWNDDREEIDKQADKIAAIVRSRLDQAHTAGSLSRSAPATAAQQLQQRHDTMQGGFSPAPKFPNEANYLFLINFALRNDNQALTELIRFDLQTMARGGIYDQVGGGFHRYATDNEWLVPHFEKMLYNQAQLARVYIDAAALTGDVEFTRVARQILDYVLRDMTAPGGGFYSATDADSEGEEGIFFLWTPAQVKAVLSEQDAALAINLFNLSDSGNFEGSNIPYLSAAADAMAAEQGISSQVFLQRVDQIRQQLYSAREQREHPGRDEKIITAWNGMMIMALAQAGQLPAGEQYARAALKAGEFLWQNHRLGGSDKNVRLYRASLEGRSSVPGVQEDYAWLADAYISLYDLSRDSRWLKRARSLLGAMLDLYWDDSSGGYFMNATNTDEENAVPTMGRPKDVRDGAQPSGNSVALNALARLARRPGSKEDYFATDARASALLSAFAQAVNRHPSAYAYLMRAAQVHSGGETGALQYAAHGGVRISAEVKAGTELTELSLNIEIQPGWHINAHEPLSDNLIPTTLGVDETSSVWSIKDVSYPGPLIKELGFQSEPLALYEGSVRLTAQLQQNESVLVLPPLRIKLRLQACDEKVCLPPENIVMQIPVP